MAQIHLALKKKKGRRTTNKAGKSKQQSISFVGSVVQTPFPLSPNFAAVRPLNIRGPGVGLFFGGITEYPAAARGGFLIMISITFDRPGMGFNSPAVANQCLS